MAEKAPEVTMPRQSAAQLLLWSRSCRQEGQTHGHRQNSLDLTVMSTMKSLGKYWQAQGTKQAPGLPGQLMLALVLQSLLERHQLNPRPPQEA